MSNPKHIKILKQGIEKWNTWRDRFPNEKPDLSDAELDKMNLRNINFRGANLRGASLKNTNLSNSLLQKSNFCDADLSNANLQKSLLTQSRFANACLSKANLKAVYGIQVNMSHAELESSILADAKLRSVTLLEANLSKANLKHADLSNAYLFRANLKAAKLEGIDLNNADLHEANLESSILKFADLSYADMRETILTNADMREACLKEANLGNAKLNEANLNGADISRANLVEADFCNAIISGCRVYGTSAWNLNLGGTIQKDLIISKEGEPNITVDDLAVAQFIYLLLNNKNIRNVLDAITSKGVLILGRFSDSQRKEVLDALREKLRCFDLLPIVFDFDTPTNKDYTETVQTLAGMSMFVIADITNPKSTPLELESTVKQFKIPYVPIIDTSVDPYPFSMLADLQNSFHWVLPTVGHTSKEQLLKDTILKRYIIDPVNKKRAELKSDKNIKQRINIITEIIDTSNSGKKLIE